jgi:hypothetical protein
MRSDLIVDILDTVPLPEGVVHGQLFIRTEMLWNRQVCYMWIKELTGGGEWKWRQQSHLYWKPSALNKKDKRRFQQIYDREQARGNTGVPLRRG